MSHPNLKTKAKLSVEQVVEIRERYNLGSGGISMDRLALEYGVRSTTVWKIIHNVNWREVNGPVFKR